MRILGLSLRTYFAISTALSALIAAAPAFAADGPWYPLKVFDSSSGKAIVADYVPLDKAVKPYNICVLFPHMKDSFWVAVAYGIVKESQSLGLNMNLYQAGGYDNLSKQLSQFDDCIANGSNAIIIGTIAQVGLGKELATAKAKGIPVVAVANALTSPDLTAGAFVDAKEMAINSGAALIADLKPGEKADVVTFPGPAGSGWAEIMNDAFKATATKDGDVKILGSSFGDTGVAAQLQLIQDALQTYPTLNVIWGSAPTAEAAIGALAVAGRSDVKIFASYENQAMLDFLKRGDITAFATQYPVAEGRMAVDQALRVLERKPFMTLVQPIPAIVTQDTMSNIDMSLVLAPTDWTPIYSVKQ